MEWSRECELAKGYLSEYDKGYQNGSKETTKKILNEVLELFPKDKQFTTISKATIYELALKNSVAIKE